MLWSKVDKATFVSGKRLNGHYKAIIKTIFNTLTPTLDPIGVSKDDKYIQDDSKFGKMHRTKGGYHYKLIRPPMHGAAAENGTIWEGGHLIFRIVVETMK